jgi:hypothetical protein
MTKKNPLRGEERKIVSTRVYRSEFANFVKICKAEGSKSVNNKMREMIREEIERNQASKIKLLKEKEGIDEDYQKILDSMKSKNFEIKILEKGWQKKKN